MKRFTVLAAFLLLIDLEIASEMLLIEAVN